MNADLIALVLALPLPVRHALLDVDPTTVGWYVYGEAAPSVTTKDSLVRPDRWGVTGAAWLPCNPGDIREHARTLRPGSYTETFGPGGGTDDFYAGLVGYPSRKVVASARGKCEHTAALALLQAVLMPVGPTSSPQA